MVVQSDVKCLYCGRVSWRVELDLAGSWEEAWVVSPPPAGWLPATPRCTHCGGPVYLDDDFQRVRMTVDEWRAKLRRMQREETETTQASAARASARDARPEGPASAAALSSVERQGGLAVREERA